MKTRIAKKQAARSQRRTDRNVARQWGAHDRWIVMAMIEDVRRNFMASVHAATGKAS